ncbi:MAG: DUF559 domain-containing protein [Chloroflexi bacterium]|nr:DUF559 domain-containing protein [Chloroflexota bacterium]
MTRGEVLVAIMNNRLDFQKARDEHWYRIPVPSAERWLKGRWPPEWLAFYHTKIFGDLAHAVHYYARVQAIHEVFRYQLFPDEPLDLKAHQRYYQLVLDPLIQRPDPIPSRRLRRIVFIPTTFEKFFSAIEINDLYDESSLEDRLWAEFKRRQIPAERQEFVQIGLDFYALDFAIYCLKGKIDVEADGDYWHTSSEKSAADNVRDNALETLGWRTLRFNTPQIREQLTEYCLPTVIENINRLGGVDEGGILPRHILMEEQAVWQQTTLFDAIEEDEEA